MRTLAREACSTALVIATILSLSACSQIGGANPPISVSGEGFCAQILGTDCYFILHVTNTGSSPLQIVQVRGLDKAGRTYQASDGSDDLQTINPGVTVSLQEEYGSAAGVELTRLTIQTDQGDKTIAAPKTQASTDGPIPEQPQPQVDPGSPNTGDSGTSDGSTPAGTVSPQATQPPESGPPADSGTIG